MTAKTYETQDGWVVADYSGRSTPSFIECAKDAVDDQRDDR